MIKNVLFLGAGRRVTMAQIFKERGYDIYSIENSYDLPIGKWGTIIQTDLKWTDDEMPLFIKKEVIKYGIILIIPFQDAVVPLCAEYKNYLIPTSPTPMEEVSRTCWDKRLFETFMLKNFPDNYPTHLQNEDNYPAIAKPIHGFGSKGLIKLDTYKDWIKFAHSETATNYIVQRFIEGKEYSVDSYFDLQGQCVDSVVRERIRVADGEVITSKTVEIPELQHLTKMVGEKLPLVGPTNMQWIIGDKPYLIEINARFGGGSTLAIKAGLDTVSLIERDYFGIKFDYVPNQWERNLLMERYTQDEYYDQNSSC